ncbi:MAG: hypothetical protein ABJC51_09350, partial [Acidobacteriota bacterium]
GTHCRGVESGLRIAAVSAWQPRTDAAWETELSLVLTVGNPRGAARTHYYALLIIPSAGFLSGRLPLAGRAQPVFATAVWLISLPVVVFGVEGWLANAPYERLLVSHYFVGGVLLLVLLVQARLTIGARDRRPAGPADQNA